VLDAAARTSHALEYQHRVKAIYATYATKGSAPQDDRGAPPETASRMARDVELPARVRELPSAREVLPNVRLAELDDRKFSEYSMNPDHPHNGGKAEGWRALGYDVDSPQARREAAEGVRELIRDGLLMTGKVAETRDTPFGPTYKVLNGFTGPNGRYATLVTCWLVDSQSDRSVPKLTTSWVQPHRDKETAR